jgi:hypothetical protein
VLGPAGVKAAAQLLHPQGWLKLAARLGNRACAHSTTCQQLGMYFNRGRAHRLCLTHRGMDTDESPFLLNDFMYDKQPSVEVRDGRALREALHSTHFGACIRISGYITLIDEDPLLLYGSRFIGPTREPGQWPHACITLLGTELAACSAILQDVMIDAGNDEMLLDEWGEWNHAAVCPGLQAVALPEHGVDTGGVLLRNCRIKSLQVGIMPFYHSSIGMLNTLVVVLLLLL